MKPTSFVRGIVLLGLLCAGCSNGPIDNCSASRCAQDGAVDAASRDASRDGATTDGAADANRVDAGAADASLDAFEAVDAGIDAATEPDVDAGVDAATDPGVDAGIDAATTPDADIDAAMPVDAGTDAAPSPLNGCLRATATDLSGLASTSVAFGGALGFSYSPACILVSVGTNVTFDGSFASHPLEGGTAVGFTLTPATSGPFIPATNTGATRTFTMGVAGTFPYYCQFHGGGGMAGVVYVE